MNKKKICIAILFLLLSLLMIFAQQLTLSQIKQLPPKNVRFYGNTFSPKLISKITPASNTVIQYLCDMDSATNYQNHILTQDEQNLFCEYYSFLPETFKKVISEKVFAIYFIDGLPYGGMADYVFNDKGDMFCILFINAKVFQISLSEWLTERDESPFNLNNSKNEIIVDCSSEYKGLLHTLIHESSHIYDYYYHITPYTEPSLKDLGVAKTNYVNIWDDYFTPVKTYRNSFVSKTCFWGFGKQIDINNAGKLLDYLNKSPFSSIYGAKNWADDFAETYTFYYLKERFNIDYKVMYKKNGNIIKTYIPTTNKLVLQRYPLLLITD